MTIDDDWLLEDRIKRIRALVRLGVQHLVFLHEAVPFYLRQAQIAEARNEELLGTIQGSSRLTPFRTLFSAEARRDHDIALGVLIDQKENRAFEKISKWVADVNDAAMRIFSQDRFESYQALGDPPLVATGGSNPGSVEQSLIKLTVDIRARVLELTGSLRDLGENEDVAPAIRDAVGGWPHLRGLVADSIIDGHLRQMRTRRTRSEISNAIGASKEIVEATFKALSAKHSVAPTKATPDLTDWWKALRPLLADKSIDKALGSTDGSLIKLISSQVSLVQNLGELRNKVGSGHGKAQHPAGLESSHALLVVDTAHTLTRFLAA
ncbi:abortive infection family protein [Pseudarthrobacter sp. NamE5]|uniref:abortive infection family protein n=1 Tax=Pseudarthrobacter sp. NamE5 TaxID=2576839 RepID=UPI00110C11BB|nr:abortive infection family protein [Pseudarthrobacter sp. NamE5]TLM80795.1 hypothetical protein FDW84_18250 [Pseudarthrobacter sp. NamE5]